MKAWVSTNTALPPADMPVWCYDSKTGEMWIGVTLDEKERFGYGELRFYYEVSDLRRYQDGQLTWAESQSDREPTHWVEVDVPMVPTST